MSNATQKKAVIATQIAESVQEFLRDNERANEVFINDLGKVSEKVLEQMQADPKDPCFAVHDVDKVRQPESTKEKGERLIALVVDGKERVRVNFAFALLVVNELLVNCIAPDMQKQLFQSAAREYVKIAGNSVQKNFFKERLKLNLEQLRKKPAIAIVQVGRAGVGKSTLTNALLADLDNASKAKVGHDFKPETIEPTVYSSKITGIFPHAIEVQVWDTPGLYDFKSSDRSGSKSNFRAKEYLKKITKKVGKFPDLILFCSDGSNPRNNADDVKIIKDIQTTFGESIWGRTLFVLTKSNCIRSTDVSVSDAEHLENAVENRRKGYEDLLRVHSNENASKSIRLIPAGSGRDLLLANGKPWLPEFWVSAIEASSRECGSLLLLTNESRLDLESPSLSDEKPGDLGKAKLGLTESQTVRVADRIEEISSQGAGVAAAIFGGTATAGAAIGAIAGIPFGGPVGAAVGSAIGGGIGAVVGGIAGAVKYFWRRK
eukprot:m.23597 g.23597  ORF g.23597 m.23597 type:complete len:489 (+) comp28504_c0_seq3:463-1929(+)